MQAKPHPRGSDLHFDLRVGAVTPRPDVFLNYTYLSIINLLASPPPSL